MGCRIPAPWCQRDHTGVKLYFSRHVHTASDFWEIYFLCAGANYKRVYTPSLRPPSVRTYSFIVHAMDRATAVLRIAHGSPGIVKRLRPSPALGSGSGKPSSRAN